MLKFLESISTIVKELPPPAVPYAIVALGTAGLFYVAVKLGAELVHTKRP